MKPFCTIEQAATIADLNAKWEEAQAAELAARISLENYIQEVSNHYPFLTPETLRAYLAQALCFDAGVKAAKT